MKPRSTWLITALCLALLCGAMAWTTRSMLRMEKNQDRMANEASVQEASRLALWRMESIASALVIAESARPPEHYRTFTAPEALLDNKTLSSWKNDGVVALSPLLREPPDLLKLHFEMEADGKLRSPQVPEGKDLAVCKQLHTPPAPVLEANSAAWSTLLFSLKADTPAGNLLAMREQLRAPASLTGNRALIWSVNDSVNDAAAPPPVPALSAPTDKWASPKPGAAKDAATDKVPVPEVTNYSVQQRAFKPEEAQAQQDEFNILEAKAREEFVKSSVSKATRNRSNSYDNSAYGQAPAAAAAPATNEGAAMSSAQEKKKENAPAPQKAQTAAPAAVFSRASEALPVQELLPPATGAMPSPKPDAKAGSTQSAPPDITDFRPLWLEDALLLTRRVSTPERQWIQGAWLDWDKLRAELLAAVQDRFPNAKVVRAPEKPEPGAHLLASLPIQLIPGAITFGAPPFWSPLKVSLSIAWVCVLLAIAAVALVLRGMMALSERRASFVSSVTHELRTPLATFKLYSEMLADGMVKEEAKKQQYLETLTSEADRLGHLVENVLAYSRIERGKGPATAATVRTGDLVHRIEPRLNQRALLAGMDFALTADPAALETPLRTDAGAVEQILCNLVDNACKYGRHDAAPGKVELVVTRERRRLCLAVRDHGPGIPRHEQNTIFLPFHKSARDAAHSAPGVGLGLALCRRLAAELGGTLELDQSWKQGSSFVLRLPV